MGKYTVNRELYSHGNYITAYEAVQEGLGKRVEIRVLAQKVKDQTKELARFQAEIRNLSILDHPSVLRVLDCGIIQGKLYYVTEAKPGIPIADWVAGSPVPSLEDKLKAAAQIAGALRYLHGKGLIHRGINDRAVNFDPDVGLAYISQFFFLKNLRTDDLTVRGIGPVFSMLCTPEGVMGQPCDARTDVFLLGSLLFRMLTGEDAYASELFLGLTPEKLIEAPSRRPKDVDPQIPPPVDVVVTRAIALAPGRRFQTAQDLHDAIADAQKKLKLGKRAEGAKAGRTFGTLDGQTFDGTPAPGASSVSKRRALLPRPSIPPPAPEAAPPQPDTDPDQAAPPTPEPTTAATTRKGLQQWLALLHDRPKLVAALLQEKEKLKLWGAMACALLLVVIVLLWLVL